MMSCVLSTLTCYDSHVLYPLHLYFRFFRKPPSDCGEYWGHTLLRFSLKAIFCLIATWRATANADAGTDNRWGSSARPPALRAFDL